MSGQEYQVTIWLFSQDQPLKIKTQYTYDLRATELNNDKAGDFVQVEDYIIRKSDIVKIVIEEIKNEKQETVCD